MSSITNKISLIMNNIWESFDKSSLHNFDFSHFNAVSNSEIVTIINKICTEKIRATNKTTVKLNYKYSYYSSLIIFLVNVVKKYLINEKMDLYPLLVVVTKYNKGHNLLDELKPMIEVNKMNIECVHYIMSLAANKGTIKTFLFWKEINKVDNIFNDESRYIFNNSIKNPDDRIFLWFLEQLKLNKKDNYFEQIEVRNSLMRSLLLSTVPKKYMLKRIKILSEVCDLVPCFDTMLGYSKEDVFVELMKYYYKKPLTLQNMKIILDRFVIIDEHKPDYLANWYKRINTPEEKNIFSFLHILKSPNLCCYNSYDNNLDKATFLKLMPDIITKLKSMMFDWDTDDDKTTLTHLFEMNCNCGRNCFPGILKKILKNGCLRKVRFELRIPPLFQLFTRFYSPLINDFSIDVLTRAMKINKLLSFLRIISKKRVKLKMINFQYKFFPIIQELMNFAPREKPVLKNGSVNWQNKLTQFSRSAPKELASYKLEQLNSFLLRENSNGLFVNNLPLNITPKFDNFKLVNAEYVEDFNLYLIFDIDLPNTNLIDRYYYLRNSHPSTKNTELTCVTSKSDLIRDFDKEKIIFEKFLKESDSTKIRWYPKCCFLVKDAIDEFKQDLKELPLIITPLV